MSLLRISFVGRTLYEVLRRTSSTPNLMITLEVLLNPLPSHNPTLLATNDGDRTLTGTDTEPQEIYEET